jgi:hypothetical protein
LACPISNNLAIDNYINFSMWMVEIDDYINLSMWMVAIFLKCPLSPYGKKMHPIYV